jgi:tetratricopeptide (TPR) repeat protein
MKDTNKEKLRRAFRILENKESYNVDIYPGRVEAAQSIFEEVLATSPECFDALVGLARCIRYVPRQYAKAVSLFECAIRLKPDEAEPYFWAGITLLRAGEANIDNNRSLLYKKAIEYFHKALDKGYSPIYIIFESLGVVYFRMANYSEAVNWFEQVLKILQPGDFAPTTFFLGGEAYQRLGNFTDAIRFFELSKKDGLPDNNEIEMKINNLRDLAENMKNAKD